MFRRIWRTFEFSIHGIMYAAAICFGFSVSLLANSTTALLWLIGGMLLLRFNFLAVLIGFCLPYVSPKVHSFLFQFKEVHFYLVLLGYNLLLFCFFWFIFRKKGERTAHLSQEFIFWDPSGIRWALWKRTAAIFTAMALLVTAVLAVHLAPPHLFAKKATETPAAILGMVDQPPALVRPAETEKLYAFYTPGDDAARYSLDAHAQHIHTLLPRWYSYSAEGSLQDQSEPAVWQTALSRQMTIMPVIQGPEKGWQDTRLLAMMKDDTQRGQLALQLLATISRQQVNGAVLDFRTFPLAEEGTLQKFAAELSRLFTPFEMKLAVMVPLPNNTVRIASLEPYVHQFIVASASGQLAGLEQLRIPAGKLVVVLDNYGQEQNKRISFWDVMGRASQQQAYIEWGKDMRASLYYPDQKTIQAIPFFDAVSLYNQIRQSLIQKPNAYALNELGKEDPSSWNVLRHLYQNEALSMTDIPAAAEVRSLGNGPLARVLTNSQAGKRTLAVNPNGLITKVHYKQIPAPIQLQYAGSTERKQVVLAFYNSPNAKYTADILNLLKDAGIRASFFLTIPDAAVQHAMLKRITAEDHEIGFQAAPGTLASDWLQQVEQQANDRLLQSLAGLESKLFYVPGAISDDAWRTLAKYSDSRGSLFIQGDPPRKKIPLSAAQLSGQIAAQLKRGPILSLPGDEEATLQALPGIIETLQEQGYTFTTVHNLLDAPEPFLTASSSEQDWINEQLAFLSAPFIQKLFTFSFYVVLVLGTIRMLVLCWLAYRQKRIRQKQELHALYQPLVSVCLAAYNEETVIGQTISSILGSSYPNLEIIVVNDGSTDHTGRVVQELAEQDTRIRLINQENKGKSHAVNLAFREAAGDIVLSIDADTQVLPDAIARLVQPFQDPRVAAVSGNVKVGNMKNRLTRWQHVEYVTSFNLDRRAFSFLHCVPVVPGALGAWRKEAIARIGYFSQDTLAEDTDATVMLLGAGYQVLYEEAALAYTEAPHDLQNFMKQRFRWVYGILQCLWKHKDALFSRSFVRTGFVVFPYMWIFQYFFQLLVPFADIYAIYSLFSDHPERIIYYYIAFLMLDWITCWFAFKLEKESTKPLWGFFLQRFFYRYLLAYTVYRSVLQALRGTRIGWNKVQRTGSVQLPAD